MTKGLTVRCKNRFPFCTHINFPARSAWPSTIILRIYIEQEPHPFCPVIFKRLVEACPTLGATLRDVAENAYVYQPLTEPDSIRLLRISPADDEKKQLQVEIIHTKLSSISDSEEDPFAFTALSYVWGQSTLKKWVQVGNKRLSVGINLYDALCHLRRKDEHITAWADAMCINQQNLDERNHQVHHMRNIYAKAWRTVIYLGPYNGNTCLSAWNYLEKESQSKLLCQDDPSFPGSFEDVEIAVLSRDWFRRVWVVQEIVMSRNPHVSITCASSSSTSFHRP